MWQALFSGACHGEEFDRLVLRAWSSSSWRTSGRPVLGRFKRNVAVVDSQGCKEQAQLCRQRAEADRIAARALERSVQVRCVRYQVCGSVRHRVERHHVRYAITFDTMGAHIRKCPHNRLTLIAAGFLRWNATSHTRRIGNGSWTS